MSDLPASARLSIPLIKRLEGCRLKAYPDPATAHLTKEEAAKLSPPREPGDPWTIGYGATGPNIKQGTVWTQAQADEDLARIATALSGEVNSLVKVPLSSESKAALISFVYNVSTGAFRSSTMLRLINAGKFIQASDQFSKWNRAGGKVFTGLIRRREIERQAFVAGLTAKTGP